MQEFQLGELLTFHYGKSLPARSRIEGKYPVMSSAGITGSHNEFLVEGPGVIVGRKGSIGTVYYEERNFYPIDTCFYLTVNDTEVLDLKYSYYLLSQSNLKELNSDAAVPGLNRDIAYTQKVQIPSKAEQLEIVAILDSYEDSVENNNRRIAILEAIAQNLYREWFINFRFPGHDPSSGQTIGTTEGCPEGASAKDGASKQAQWQETPQGKIPLGWEVKKLGEIAKVNPESITKKNAPDEIKYIDISSVNTGSIEELKPMSFAEAPSRARRIVRHNDIIWATVRPNRKQYSYIAKPDESTIASTGFAVLRAETVPASFLYCATTTDSFTAYLVNHATGAAYPAVNASVFENADILVPNQELLTKFDEVVGVTLAQTEVLKRKNQNLRQQRDLLLPKLIKT